MHSHDLAHLAALSAVHGEQLIAADAATMDRMLSVYWKASRCRLDRWCRTLALVAKHPEQSAWTEYEIGAVEEILVSDLVTRIVAAIATAHDERLSTNESAPVARNIFTAHVDVRRRAIALAIAPHRDAHQAEDFLALRRQCERWTDLLLAYLTPHFAVDEFAFDAARVGDFAFDAREHLRSGCSSDTAVTMIIAGMRSSLGPIKSGRTLNTDLNQEIATALVSGFDPAFFDSHGHLQSAWLERLRRVPADAPLDAEAVWQLSPHARHDVPRPARWRW
ncbi:MAG: hypothetical protein AB7G28_25610 [Pirellulales bacterium]